MNHFIRKRGDEIYLPQKEKLGKIKQITSRATGAKPVPEVILLKGAQPLSNNPPTRCGIEDRIRKVHFIRSHREILENGFVQCQYEPENSKQVPDDIIMSFTVKEPPPGEVLLNHKGEAQLDHKGLVLRSKVTHCAERYQNWD